MKTLQKILLILIIGACVFMVMPNNVVRADGTDINAAMKKIQPENPKGEIKGITGVINKLLGFLQVASGFAAVIAIAVIGFNYITGTPDVKSELPKTAIPILVGLILVFGAASIARFIINIAT